MPLDTETDTETGTEADSVLTVTHGALDKVIELRDAEDDPTSLGLRVEIVGANGVDFTYDLSFEAVSTATEGDHVSDQGGLVVVVAGDSVDRLRGAILDLPANAAQGGLVIRNPNRPNLVPEGPLELTGDLPDKVQQLLDERINPSLAVHGGFAALVGVEGTRVFITMGGGCHGCAMSNATLVDGIQVMMREAIPEVTEVIDATDHSTGENPFFA